MIEWIDFENYLVDYPYFMINNKCKKNIVLFGNCHVATLGYLLNDLLDKKYNIFIIISWWCDKKGFDNFNMDQVNNRILNILQNCCDVFLYQHHIKDYGVCASYIETLTNKNATIYKLPNLRLTFDSLDKSEYTRSLEILTYNIERSHFPHFRFVFDNINTIRFFNTAEHPTDYLLYLLAKDIVYKICNSNYIVSIDDYHNPVNQSEFKNLIDYVSLPGFNEITPEISKITGMNMNLHYVSLLGFNEMTTEMTTEMTPC